MANVAFLGMGVMGAPMAGHLVEAGHDLRVFNRSEQKSINWCDRYGGDVATNPADAAKGADFVFACVGNDEDVRAITIGNDGAFGTMKSGAIFVDHTTTSAQLARMLDEEAQKRNLSFVDAPVSGGQAGAENGVLAIMCGGAMDDFLRVEPVMQAYGKTIARIGEVGAGQQAKMVNQIAIAGLLQGLSEALAFCKLAQLDGETVLSVITGGAAGSWQMSNRGETMLEDQFDFGFAVDWMRKDLGIAVEEGARLGASLDVTKLIDQYYGEVQEMGGGRWDTSSLIKRLPR